MSIRLKNKKNTCIRKEKGRKMPFGGRRKGNDMKQELCMSLMLICS